MNNISYDLYRAFWEKCGRGKLPRETLLKIANRISELSLRRPLWLIRADEAVDGGKTLTELYPEVVPQNMCKIHLHTTTISGLYLAAIYSEIVAVDLQREDVKEAEGRTHPGTI